MNKQGDHGIGWTDFTSNPVYVTHKETGKRGWHCVRVSNGVDPSGCDNCDSEQVVPPLRGYWPLIVLGAALVIAALLGRLP